ncbi:MAG: hypothetical protein Q4C13_06550, partial [Clostridia bacterium]|nr:hypothetical protein [Clostridia bacterium]
MTNESQTGAKKLAERILEDARADARLSAEETAKSVEAIRRESGAAIDRKRAEHEKKRAVAVSGVIDGCRTRASIEGRKAALAKKRAVIDEAFGGAYAALLALDAGVRDSICRRLLLSEAEGGESVQPAAADRAAIAACIAENPSLRVTLDA